MLIENKNEQTDEGPEEITVDNVIFWSRHTRELEGSPWKKALLLIKHDCIQYVGYDSTFDSKYTFICLPLSPEETFGFKGKTFWKKPFMTSKGKGYNTSEYLIYKQEDKRWVCNCQGWRKAEMIRQVQQEGREDALSVLDAINARIDAEDYDKFEKIILAKAINDGIQCAHGLALMYAFKIRKFNKEHGASDEDLQVEESPLAIRKKTGGKLKWK